MAATFPKSTYLGATRQLLADLTFWLGYVFDQDVGTRLFGIGESMLDARPEDWEPRGAAGPEIEQSNVFRSMERILDCLNTNTWNGDADSLRWELKELRPLYELVSSKRALVDPDEGVVELGTPARLYREVFDVVSARVSLDMGMPLTIREMSCVSGLAEKTVRMAATGRNRNPELATKKAGAQTLVEASEARRWLKEKQINYQRVQYISRGALPIEKPSTEYELGRCLLNLRDAQSICSVEQVGKMLKWDEPKQHAYGLLEKGQAAACATLLTLDESIALAKLLCPSESAELARRLDAVIRPIAIEQRLSRQDANQNNKQGENESAN